MMPADQYAGRSAVPARWLPLVRCAWLATAGAVVAAFISSFPSRSALLLVAVPPDAPGLAALGLSTADLRTAASVLDACTLLAFSAIALLMFWRKSNEWMGLVASLALLTFGAMPGFLRYAMSGNIMRAAWDSPDVAVLALGTTLSVGTLFIFPDGRFYPRWTRILLAVLCGWALTWTFDPRLNPYNWRNLGGLALTAVYATGTIALLYRYSRTGRGPQRQQMKWVIYAIVVQVLAWGLVLFAFFVVGGRLSPQSKSLAILLGGRVITLAELLVPLAFGIAILRYKLWDIDLIINRTLVYVPLTGILAGIYAVCTAVSQKVFQAFTGQKSDAAVVFTTLLIVAIFAPLKDALQHAVERRYRDDPLAAVERFDSQIRYIVDVFDAGRITQRALQTVATALRARAGAVYLDQEGQRRLVYSYGEWDSAGAALEIAIEAHEKHLGCLQLAARLDGAPYSARDRAVVGQTFADVGLAIYLASLRRQPVETLDEW